jgi:hypothetical protein
MHQTGTSPTKDGGVPDEMVKKDLLVPEGTLFELVQEQDYTNWQNKGPVRILRGTRASRSICISELSHTGEYSGRIVASNASQDIDSTGQSCVASAGRDERLGPALGNTNRLRTSEKLSLTNKVIMKLSSGNVIAAVLAAPLASVSAAYCPTLSQPS